jgi:ligand-binding sensor domain-containing protein
MKLQNPYRHLLVGCLLVLTQAFAGQVSDDIKFDRLTSENIRLVKGVSQNWIYAILQDRYGYIWLGTWDGLNKFDGYNFTIYNVADGLSDHTIYTLLEDYDGYIWIGTDNGLNRYDRRTRQIEQVPIPTGDSAGRYYERINFVIQARDSCIWVGTGSGLKKYNPRTQAFKSYFSSPQEYYSPRSNYILHLFEDDRGILWISTTYGLLRFDPATERSTRYYHIPGDSTGLSHDNIRCVLQERSGNFWIGTRYGLNYYDTTTQKIRQYYHRPDDHTSLSNNWIRTIYEDRAGNIWFGTDNGGLCRYDRKNDAFIRFKNEMNDDNSLSNNRVYSIFEDFDGNLWIGTYNGVNKINRFTNNFNHVYQTGRIEQELSSNFIWDFFEDSEGRLWIGTSAGVNIRDRETGAFTWIGHQPGVKNSLNSDEVRTMAYTPQFNCVWLGLYGTGLDRYDLGTGQVRHFLPAPDRNSLSDIYISDLLYDDEGSLWIATSRGLDRFDPVTNSFKVYTHTDNVEGSLSNDVVISLFLDSKKNLWIGTDKGLNRYIPETDGFESYFTSPDGDIKANAFFAIAEGRDGVLWLGTSGSGLIKFEPSTLEYQVFTDRDGLPNNIVYGILEHEDGNLWMSTNMGLARFLVENEQFIAYDVKDGIQSYEFNLGSAYKGKDGTMYFGGMNGYNAFNPNDIRTNPNRPVVVVSSFRKFNELQPLELLNGDTIRLAHDENFFSFEIASLDYTNPANNKYQYYLEGFDKSWTTVDAGNRIAEYKKVRPGRYVFYAKGSNNDGVWNEEGITITVIVTPPWYATWWFRLLLVVVILSVGWMLVTRRMKQIRRKHEVERRMLEIEKQKFELEQKALRLQMNPHFIFNSLNSIQSYILTHDTDMAVTYLGKFSQLMRLILSSSGNNFVVLKEELKAITHYLDLEKLRFDNKFDYSISLDEAIDTEFIEIPPMVIQPYIENAIIHGILHKPSRGKINIDFRINEKYVLCTITDNGIGREKASMLREEAGIKRRSSGMYITQARLEMLNQEKAEDFSVKVTDLKNKNGTPAGTRVELHIQYNED